MPEPPELLLQASRFSVVRMTEDFADGTSRAREVILHPGSVVILPLLDPLLDGGRVVLIRNYRVAVGETLIELPAGTLEAGEDPRVAAERELAEETGYRCRELRSLHAFYMSPGILRERMHLFLATGLVEGNAAREPGERIENLIVSWAEALRLAVSGQIQDAKTLTAILLYEHLRKTSDV